MNLEIYYDKFDDCLTKFTKSLESYQFPTLSEAAAAGKKFIKTSQAAIYHISLSTFSNGKYCAEEGAFATGNLGAVFGVISGAVLGVSYALATPSIYLVISGLFAGIIIVAPITAVACGTVGFLGGAAMGSATGLVLGSYEVYQGNFEK